MAAVLVITDEVSLSLGAIRDLSSEGLNQEDAMIITQSGLLGGKLPFGDESLDSVFALFTKPENITDDWVKEINRVLKPASKAFFQTCSLKSDEQIRPQLERKLLISGFVDVESNETPRSIQIKGKKVSWTTGSSFPIKIGIKSSLPKIEVSDEADLIDEDSLLTEDDFKKPQLPLVGDCEVGSTRKACKNCTCGRAEEEKKVEKLGLTAEQIYNPQSACGSCGLGDAFRCAGCPYKGLPPFKLGEKVTLANDFLAADI